MSVKDESVSTLPYEKGSLEGLETTAWANDVEASTKPGLKRWAILLGGAAVLLLFATKGAKK